MSFVNILKKIAGVAVKVEQVASPILQSGIVPGGAVLDNLFQTVVHSVQSAEANSTSPKTGSAKLDAVIADFEGGLEVAREIAASLGKTVTYPQDELKAGIADLVSAYNHFAAVKAGIKQVDAPKPAA